MRGFNSGKFASLEKLDKPVNDLNFKILWTRVRLPPPPPFIFRGCLLQYRMIENEKTKYLCSIYNDRPETCRKYPWNHANQIFAECIFFDKENEKLRTHEEQLKLNTEKEISDYCVECGRCCFFGPAACSMLKIVKGQSS